VSRIKLPIKCLKASYGLVDDSPSESEPEETLIEKPNRGGGRGRGKPRGGTQSTRGGVSRTPRASHVDPDDIESEDGTFPYSSLYAICTLC
jgi:hypothetical protein